LLEQTLLEFLLRTVPTMAERSLLDCDKLGEEHLTGETVFGQAVRASSEPEISDD
jgi:hypothetical protein